MSMRSSSSSSSKCNMMEFMLLGILIICLFGIATLYLENNSNNAIRIVNINTNNIMKNDSITRVKTITTTTTISKKIERQQPITSLNNNNNIIKEENVVYSYTNTVDATTQAFSRHPFHSYNNKKNSSLVDYMKYLSLQPECITSPIFITMARVQNDLYWQLIENFFYTQLKFNHFNCSVMICVSDNICIEKCKSNNFPCYPYYHENKDDHVMIQVAEIKLVHVGKALEMGINIFLLDLDVGFLRDPALLYTRFFDNNDTTSDYILAQMDVGTSTDKVTKTWVTNPRPNFGVFIVRSHPLTTKIFKNAYTKYYLKSSLENKVKVATDQNAIKNAITHAVWRWNFNFSYFSVGFDLATHPRPVKDEKVLLLDYVSLKTPTGISFELGGELSKDVIGDAIAVHATCHERSTKLLALKSANAFWNSLYYNPHRRTITKPLMFFSKRQLRMELISLQYLAIMTNRSLILPNILIGVGSNIKGQLKKELCENHNVPYCFEVINSHDILEKQDQSHAAFFQGEYYWPSWRTIIDVGNTPLEPSYYFKIQNDFKLEVPEPYVHRVDVNLNHVSLNQMLNDISQVTEERLVLDLYDSKLGKEFRGGPDDIYSWASSSISAWNNREEVVNKWTYLPLPPHHNDKIDMHSVDICNSFLKYVKGNRSCFSKCS